MNTLFTIKKNKHILAKVLGILLLVFLGCYNQPYYPTTWLDEGFVLQGAMNLSTLGEYGLRSSEGFRPVDAQLIANGPGVVVPISLAFELFGVGLLQARLVMVIFLLFAISAYFLLAKRLFGEPSAWLGCFLLLALPQEGFLLYGRHALGMIPSLVFFLFGSLMLIKALEQRNLLKAASAGALFGLAMITKGQYLQLIPVLLVILVADLVYYRLGNYRVLMMVILAIFMSLAIWYGIQLKILGMDGFTQNYAALRFTSSITITAFSLSRIPGNLWYLVRSGILFIVVPGWIYALWQIRKKELDKFHLAFLVIFVIAWLFWFAFISVGYHRYAFDPYVIGTFLTSGFLVNALSHKGDWQLRLWKNHNIDKVGKYAIYVLAGVIIIFGFIGLSGQVGNIISEPNTSPQVIAKYINENIDQSSVIESWEWELDLLTPDYVYHHPDNKWVDIMQLFTQFGIEPTETYDPSSYNPDYLIDGSFSKWTGLYSHYLSSNCCTLVKKIGQYDLYLVNDSE